MSKTQQPRCSVVIRCHNEEEHIGRLLGGIMEQTLSGETEVIVVDSGSTDATLTIASRYPVKILHIKPEEFTFGYALNVGCRASSGEFLVIVSAHVYPVYRDWLEKLLAPFEDPKVGLVYGKQRGDSGTKYSEQQIFKQWFPEQSTMRQGHPFCNNANTAVRRSLWETMNYNEELTGLEDLDWAKRAMAAGHCIAYAAEAEIIHVHREKPRQTYNRYLREGMAHKRIFPEQSFSLWDFLRMLPMNFFADSRRAWRERTKHESLFIIILSIGLFRLMQFWGTYRGFAKPGTVTRQLKKRFYYPDSDDDDEKEATADTPERRIDYAQMKNDDEGGQN